VASVPLQQELRHLERAFRNCFEGRAKYPTFKKKRGRQAAMYAHRRDIRLFCVTASGLLPIPGL
jgi:transposase